MKTGPLATLFHPFETDTLPAPGAGTSALFLGAEPGFRLPDGFDASLLAVQGFRPAFLKLQREGHKVVPIAEGDGFDLVLVLASRHRGESELRVAEALSRVREGGLIVVAGAKDDGIASLLKRVSSLVAIDGQLPKFHGIAFWLTRLGDAAVAVEALRTANPETLIDDRFHVAPGMFSAGGVDRGSQLLADHLPGDIKGAVADFCAGWGFLGSVLAERFPAIAALDLYEADFAALEAAKRNLAGVPAARFFWHDLVTEAVEGRYDSVVMNPPFHASRRAEPEIGQAMIGAAAKALKRGGRLFMVANRQLPYEQTLTAAFARHRQVFADGKFKIFEAVR